MLSQTKVHDYFYEYLFLSWDNQQLNWSSSSHFVYLETYLLIVILLLQTIHWSLGAVPRVFGKGWRKATMLCQHWKDCSAGGLGVSGYPHTWLPLCLQANKSYENCNIIVMKFTAYFLLLFIIYQICIITFELCMVISHLNLSLKYVIMAFVYVIHSHH